jgi:alanine dehydrogenase
MDSIEVTIIRTGAATAVAAKYLSRENAAVALICGCGNQGRISILYLVQIRKIKKVYLYDTDKSQSTRLAHELKNDVAVEMIPVEDFASCSIDCDIIITCTPSKTFFLRRDHVAPGTFIAAVGSDSEHKQEIEPELLRNSKVVTDSTSQCAVIGELHHCIENGLMATHDVHGELGEVIAGTKPGRESQEEIIVFDSTGTALQDVAAAAIVYEKAMNGDLQKLNFAN